MLDSRLPNVGGAGPPKWESRSRIRVSIGNSPLHAGSISLVWNPTKVRVSPQCHVVFEDEFSTLTYTKTGTIPPNWEKLVKYSSKMKTDQVIDL